MPLVLAPVVISILTWIFREIVIKFVVFTAVFALVLFFVPFVVKYLGNFIKLDFLTSAFTGLDPQICFILNFFSLGYGLPLLLSAYVSRFLIRRIPFIG
jgi:hypothetical protein